MQSKMPSNSTEAATIALRAQFQRNVHCVKRSKFAVLTAIIAVHIAVILRSHSQIFCVGMCILQSNRFFVAALRKFLLIMFREQAWYCRKNIG